MAPAVALAVVLAALVWLPLFVVVVAGAALGLWRWIGAGADCVRQSLPGAPADPVRDARALNLLESLSASIGVATPSLLVAPGPAADVAAVGRPTSSVVVVTQPVLDRLDRLQLEAVFAHELVQIKDGTTGARDAAIATWGRLGKAFPYAARRCAAVCAVDARQADVVALGITRYPPALLAALVTLRDMAPDQAPPGPASLRPLWSRHGAPQGETDLRIAVLGELV